MMMHTPSQRSHRQTQLLAPPTTNPTPKHEAAMVQISRRANKPFKTAQKGNTQYMMYSQPQYYRSFLSTHDPNAQANVWFRRVSPFTPTLQAPGKKSTLKQMLKVLYDNNELCSMLLSQSGQEQGDDVEELLTGLQERAANLMPLVHNRNKKIPITSMSVKLMQPLSLNRGRHIHTSPLDSTLTMEKLKTAYQRYKGASVAQIMFQNKQDLSREVKRSTKDCKLIENRNLMSSADSCEQRELYLGRTLYYEESLKKEIEELLLLLQENYRRQQMKERLVIQSQGLAGRALCYVAKKQLESLKATTREFVKRKNTIVDLEAEEMDERFMKGSLTTEDILMSKKKIDVDQLAREQEIALDESDTEKSFKLPPNELPEDGQVMTPKVRPPKAKRKIKRDEKAKWTQQAQQQQKEWSIKNMLFYNESQRLFGKEQKFVKKNTFSLIRNKKT